MTLTAERDIELVDANSTEAPPSRKASWFKRAGVAVGGIALAAGISVIGAPQAQATYWPVGEPHATKAACFDAGYEYQAQYPQYTSFKCEKITGGAIKLFMWTND